MTSTVTDSEPKLGEEVAPLSWRDQVINLIVNGPILGRVLAVLLALVVAAPVFVLAGASPVESFDALFSGSFGSMRAFADVLNRADTLLLLALGIAVCLRAGFFNIGAEGQLWLGALGATIVAINWGGPPLLGIVLSTLVGMVFGALWSLIVAVLKIYAKVDELIGSLMLNYVAILLIGALTFGPLQAYRAGQTERIPQELFLPTLFGTRLHAGFLLALATVVVVWLVLYRTTLGYELRTLGGNPAAARFSGINAKRATISVALIGGAICGLAGANAVLGVQHVLLSTFSPGWGYTAIAVALLGGLAPAGILLAAVLFGALEIGASNMQYAAQVPAAMGGLIEGLILIFFLIGITLPLAWRRRLTRQRDARPVEGGE